MRRPIALSALAAALLLGALWWWQAASRGALVVYCAHDAIYADKILRDFEKQSGIRVAVRYDTEATKSLGLTELLIREKDAPRCDVFWNNELLGMLDLQERRVLQPYQGSGFARIPKAFKAEDGSWAGFAARLRVIIFNTSALDPYTLTLSSTEKSLLKTHSIDEPSDDPMAHMPGFDLSKFAIAKPLYGTTLTHYTVLWHEWDDVKLKTWHRVWQHDGIKVLNGNAAVKDAVAAGACAAGYVDTDDYFEAKDDGRSVAMRPVRLWSGKTICIPNTVAIIRGNKHEEAAHKLVDFLLSEETELALANSKSRQIPLGPVPVDRLPAEVRELAEWAHDGYDLTTIGSSRADCLEWLKSEYAP